MKISKAVKLAMEQNGCISRTSAPLVKIHPTDTLSCCLLIVKGANASSKWWNPTAGDLTAYDWKVTE